MRKFAEIYAVASERKADLDERVGSMDLPKSSEELAAIPDDRWLSGMTRCVFNAGFNWYVVGNMWPAFEEVFGGFEIGPCSMLNDDDLGRLISDRRIVRSGRKIRTVPENATFIKKLYVQHGGAGSFFGEWPAEDYVGLLRYMRKQGSRLGGNTGRYFLRRMGVDGFLLSRDVIARLISEGIVDKSPTSQRDMTAIQEAFNIWREQSGRTLTEVSRILAFSVG
jgi:3-methyladenine DNA glycosylase Tag